MQDNTSAPVCGRNASPLTTTNLTATDAAGLGFAVGASEVWQFMFSIPNGSSSAAGIKFAITFPSGGTLLAVALGTTSGITAFTTDNMTVSGTLGAVYNTAGNQLGFCQISGTIVVSTTPGTLQLQYAKVTSGTATILANANFLANRIA